MGAFHIILSSRPPDTGRNSRSFISTTSTSISKTALSFLSYECRAYAGFDSNAFDFLKVHGRVYSSYSSTGPIKTLEVEPGYTLFHCLDQDFIGDDLKDDFGLVEGLVRYVVSGPDDPAPKHPSLGHDQSSSESQEYLQEILRQVERTDPDSNAAEAVRNAIEAATRLTAELTMDHELADADGLANTKDVPFQVIEGDGKPVFLVEVEGETRRFTPEDFSPMALARMRETRVSCATGSLMLQQASED